MVGSATFSTVRSMPTISTLSARATSTHHLRFSRSFMTDPPDRLLLLVDREHLLRVTVKFFGWRAPERVSGRHGSGGTVSGGTVSRPGPGAVEGSTFSCPDGTHAGRGASNGG